MKIVCFSVPNSQRVSSYRVTAGERMESRTPERPRREHRRRSLKTLLDLSFCETLNHWDSISVLYFVCFVNQDNGANNPCLGTSSSCGKK